MADLMLVAWIGGVTGGATMVAILYLSDLVGGWVYRWRERREFAARRARVDRMMTVASKQR